MRKNNILLGMVLVMGLAFTGCGQNTSADIARVQQENVQNENSYEMEADAPKDLAAEEAAEEVAQKAAQEAAIQKAAEEAAEKAVAEAQKAAEEEAKKAEEAKKQTSNDTTENIISKDEAINIVLKKVSGAKKSDVYIEKDYDDGYWKYEGEIHHNQKEYEFELNAENGKIMEWSVESIYD